MSVFHRADSVSAAQSADNEPVHIRQALIDKDLEVIELRQMIVDIDLRTRGQLT